MVDYSRPFVNLFYGFPGAPGVPGVPGVSTASGAKVHQARAAIAPRAKTIAAISHHVAPSIERLGSRVGSPVITIGSTPISVSVTESERNASPVASRPSNTRDQSVADGNVTRPPQVSGSIATNAVGGSSSKDENGLTRTASNVRSTFTVISTTSPPSSLTAPPSAAPNGGARTTNATRASRNGTGVSVGHAPSLVRFFVSLSYHYAPAFTARNSMTAQRTLLDKVWDQHVVHAGTGEPDLLYIDLHLVHEVTSPQAFESLNITGRAVRRPELTLATIDHAVPTTPREQGIDDPMSVIQIATLEKNAAENSITLFGIDDVRQGIVHVIGPEQGATQPGMTIVCGDSHTATHGAFGALAFGIGTSEVEHVLATQTLHQRKPKSMAVTVNGDLPFGVTAKDIILGIIAKIGTAGATGHVIEYRGSAIEQLSMEGRMTICNMSIEAGARAGMIAPDDTTIEYLRGRPLAPTGDDWDVAIAAWQELSTDDGAKFDAEVAIDATELEPFVSWGTNPGQTLPVSASVPAPEDFEDPVDRDTAQRALEYMQLDAGTAITDIAIDTVFIGSCTNGRIEDLRAAAAVLEGSHIAETVTGIVVPGSGLVKIQAEEEGLDAVFLAAGLEWREPGCSMCLAMNPDMLQPGERCASTSNRNFEGRQGRGGLTHLVSPEMAAAAAIHGHFVDIREMV